MIQKLRFKFVLINMSIVTIMLCIILGLVFYFTSADLEQESIRMMENIATQPFQQGTPKELGEDVRLPFFTLQLTPYGELLSAGGGYYDLSDGDFLNHLIDRAFSSPKRLGVLSEYNLRYYRMDTPASQYLVFADISSEVATLDGLRNTCLLIGALSFFVFLWASIVLSKWAVKPVDRAWKQQRQFVAAASHELKTPLTVIMANAELMQDPDYGEENRVKFLDNILVMSRQMRRLVEQMLSLAQTDSADSRQPFVRVDLNRLVSQTLLTFEPVFYEKGLSLTSQTEEGITVMGNESQLRQVLEILLDNAQKYSQEGGSTQVSLKREKRGRCLLTVANQGPPIPPDDLQNIFKRFYRMDQARSNTGSFGLGLSIAQGIVTQHKGKIWAESSGGVNRFLVELSCHEGVS